MDSENLSSELTDQDRLLLVFAYLGPLAIFTLVASRREFVKWHARQGLVLFAVLAALYVVLTPMYRILNRYVWWWIGELFWAAVWLAVLGALLTMMLCITRALEGERFKIPILGDLADRL
jgi:uncharacterized membrane protein